MSLRERIQAIDDRQRQTLEVPEWGETITIRELSGRDRDEIAQLFLDARRPDPHNPGGTMQVIPAHHREQYIIRGVIDPDTGAPVFQADDISWLQDKSQAALDRIVEAIQDLSAMGAEALDEAVEKSPPGLSIATGSA